MSNTMQNKVIIILGPTCVGKTGVSILLARKLGTEIISADSMQIYRGMDIGTGKPSATELSLVKHHLLDIALPTEIYSVGRFVDEIVPIIKGLHSKGKIPVVVGGTGLYIKAMTRGLFKGPSKDEILRDELLEEEKTSPGVLYKRLQRLDLDTAEKIMPNDTRRIIRALEVCLTTGAKMSGMKEGLTNPMPYDFIKIGLKRQRAELYKMIEARVDKMLENGLVDEVKDILRMNPALTAMQAIGYKEIASYLKGEYAFEEAVRLIKRNTKRYAKRQFTWFNQEENIHWLDVTGMFSSEEILAKVIKEVEILKK